ncbi:MAG: glycosyltransferase [Candidatus Omnitrophota bacterium]
MKKILIFYISDGGGHSKAADNIKEAFKYRDPQAQVITMNGLGYFFPYWEKIIDFLYTAVIKHIPSVWGKIYDREPVVRRLTPCRKFVSILAFKKLSRLINKIKPDCIIATQAFPCGLVADYKQKLSLDIPLVAVVTDYYPHKFWIHKTIDKYVVACPEAKEVLVQEGVDKSKIKLLGIPISVKFMGTFSRSETAVSFGMDKIKPAVLLMGGGSGFGPIQKVSRELERLDLDFQIIVLCGRNKKLYKWFSRNKRKFKKHLFYFSYIECVNKIMDFSNIIITKAGGITVSEALAKGLSIIITRPIPGQEERNVGYLLKKEAIVEADNPHHSAELVKSLILDKKKMYNLKENAKTISFIDSSLRIYDLISGLLG